MKTRRRAVVERAVHLARVGVVSSRRFWTYRVRGLPWPLPALRAIRLEGHDTFFGYYDKTPFDATDASILTLNVPASRRSVLPWKTGRRHGRVAKVGVFERDSGRHRILGETATWCWQQGCRLQWHPQEANRLVVYNVSVEGRQGSVIQDAGTGEVVDRLGFPLYDIAPNGKSALTLNFARLDHFQPGYGYPGESNAAKPIPSDDGIWTVELQDGTGRLLLSYRDLARVDPPPEMAGARHNVNHISINPSGTRFMFVHYWFDEGRRFSRLCTAAVDGSDVRVLQKGGKIGHYCWRSDQELLCFVAGPDGDGFFLFPDRPGGERRAVGHELPHNGHVLFSPTDADVLVCDTVSKRLNRLGERLIVLHDLKSGATVPVGSFHSPFRFRGPTRCDPHPRWNRGGDVICIDSTHEMRRSMYELDVSRALAALGRPATPAVGAAS